MDRDSLEIPLVRGDPRIARLGALVAQPHPVPRAPTSMPFERIRAVARVPDSLRTQLPRGWERVGAVVLLKLPAALRTYGEAVGRAYAEVLGAQAVLDVSGGIHGPWRTPRTTLLWGSGTKTVHVEHGVRFALDPQQVMFSSGNLEERIRMGRVVRPGEVVVDLFAGIGYYSLPMAVHGTPRRIVACEANPIAYDYLRAGVSLNRVETVDARLGDCRTVAPTGIANRVLLDYLREGPAYLPTALRAFREGGWLHYHEACPDARRERISEAVERAATAEGRAVGSQRLRRVKAYAPGVTHYVLDALIGPEGSPPIRSP